MTIQRRELLASGAAAAVLGGLPRARAQGGGGSAPPIRIGVLTDMSGPYRDISGPNVVVLARQAVQDFGASARGLNVEILQADHQNKTDVGASTVRQWFDQRDVDAVVDCNNSAVGLAVAGIAREKDKVFLASGASTAASL